MRQDIKGGWVEGRDQFLPTTNQTSRLVPMMFLVRHSAQTQTLYKRYHCINTLPVSSLWRGGKQYPIP